MLKKVYNKIENFAFVTMLKNRHFRTRMLRMAFKNQLRGSYFGDKILENLNFIMSRNPSYHDEFQKLTGSDINYSKTFWSSDLGYLWYKGNHANNTNNEYFNFAVNRFRSNRYTSHLDVGCGWGELSLLISSIPNANKIHGIDVSKEVIDAAMEKNREANPQVKFYVAEVGQIEEKFDLITLFGSADYIMPDEFYHVLKKIFSIAQKEILIINSLRKMKFEEALNLKMAEKVIRYDIGYIQPINYFLSLLQKEFSFTYNVKKMSSDSLMAQIIIT